MGCLLGVARRRWTRWYFLGWRLRRLRDLPHGGFGVNQISGRFVPEKFEGSKFFTTCTVHAVTIHNQTVYQKSPLTDPPS